MPMAIRLPIRVPVRLPVRLLTTASLTAGLCAGLPAPPAFAACEDAPNTAGSVDGSELTYDLHTKYTAEWDRARAAWNALGKVDIRPDTGTAYADVDATDVDRSDVGWSGLWEPHDLGSDDIVLNDHFLKDYSAETKNGVVTHELGHALRLGHHTDTSAVMYCDDTRTAGTPSADDIAAYRAIWV
ncbi:hypothetical protein SBI_06086 [Streptomyces bingchenggensis BCW-1]|uniref:Peptidase M10 metallopeptidase domain-containing protein n=1 Tax=Streptomyces bingchenggensis (strain BCW-1) TaxID=749414 RepID=D7CI06_STRBB|nr:hypothetical protein SBI_06086 [Streptomyces bingchenggensis BCW-1]